MSPRLTEETSAKTYSSGYSLVVTHPTTNPPISVFSTADRTGCAVFHFLWPYAWEGVITCYIYPRVEYLKGHACMIVPSILADPVFSR